MDIVKSCHYSNPPATKLSCDTQDHYTPDAGTEGDVYCGVCGDLMNCKRNVYGPRGYMQAIGGGKSLHDSYTCPNHSEMWHMQVKALREWVKKIPSKKISSLAEEEINEILETREATKSLTCHNLFN